jgi:hypothetical protein
VSTVAINEPKYTIEPSDYRCAACTAEFPFESPFFSAVFFEGEIFRRRSFCVPCWKKPPENVAGAFAYWRTKRPSPQAGPKKLRFDPEMVLEFFRRLAVTLATQPVTSATQPVTSATQPVTSATHPSVAADAAVAAVAAETPPDVQASPETTPAAPSTKGPAEPTAATPAETPAGPFADGQPTAPAQPAGEPKKPPLDPGEAVRLRLVIALLLIRRKTLVFESSAVRDGREWLKLTEKADPQKTYLVENPPLSDKELDAVRASLCELLQMDIA